MNIKTVNCIDGETVGDETLISEKMHGELRIKQSTYFELYQKKSPEDELIQFETCRLIIDIIMY